MHEFRNSFLRWLVVLFSIALVGVHELQGSVIFDDLGLWYTIYCAAGISIPLALVFAFFRDTENPWRLRR
jgi:ABC-type polysaccharide/polyol phosphate export permease